MVEPDRRLVIITGAAGSIGSSTIDRLLSDSDRTTCLAVDANEESLDALVRSRPGRIVPCLLDLSDTEAIVARLPEAIAATGLPLTGLVNGAGINIVRDSLEVTPSEWRAVIGVNLEATFFACQQAAKFLVRGSAIVNIASVTMHFGTPRRAAYCSSKAAVGALTRTLAVEWADRGIRVNAVAPGYIDSPMVDRAVRDGAYRREDVAQRHALGRLGRPDEIAAAISYLLSEDASFITGTVLDVEGGLLANRMDGASSRA